MGIRKNNFFGGVAVEGIAMIITTLFGIIVTPIYLQYVSTSEFGIWSTILEMMTLLTLLNAGVGLLIIQTISKTNKKGSTYVNENLSSLMLYQLLILAVMVLACIILYFVLPIFQNSPLSHDVQFQVYSIMVANLLFSTFSTWFISVLMGHNQIIINNTIANLQKIATQLLPVLLMFLGFKILSFPYSYLAISIAGLIVYFIFAFRYVTDRISFKYVSFRTLKENSAFSLRMFLGGAGYYVFNFTDTIVIASVLSGHFVTLYVLTMKLGNVTRFISAKVLSSAFPSIAQLIAEENYEKLHEIILKLFRFSFRVALFFPVFIILFNEIFIDNWVGSDKYGGNLLTLFSSIICFRELIFPVFSAVIFSTKDIKVINHILLCEAGSNLLLSLLLIKVWGITGVALATVISSCIFSLGYGWWKAKLIVRIKLWDFLISMTGTCFKSLPCIFVMMAGLLLLKDFFSWFLFIAVLAVSALTNLIFFEGRVVIKNRMLPLKHLVQKLIDEA